MPRRFITSCLPGYLGILLGIITCVQGASSQASERKPNVIVFLADDLGYQELGCYGQKVIQTPSIDALAEKGLRMTQFYSGSPVCAPSRGMLLTGKHSGHAYVRDNRNPKGPLGVAIVAHVGMPLSLIHI